MRIDGNCRWIVATLSLVLVEDLHDVFGDLLVLQMVVCEQLVDIVAVVEHLAHTEVGHADVRGSVEASHGLTISTVKTSVLDSGHKAVVGFQVFKELLIESGEVARIDERGVDALL